MEREGVKKPKQIHLHMVCECCIPKAKASTFIKEVEERKWNTNCYTRERCTTWRQIYSQKEIQTISLDVAYINHTKVGVKGYLKSNIGLPFRVIHINFKNFLFQ